MENFNRVWRCCGFLAEFGRHDSKPSQFSAVSRQGIQWREPNNNIKIDVLQCLDRRRCEWDSTESIETPATRFVKPSRKLRNRRFGSCILNREYRQFQRGDFL